MQNIIAETACSIGSKGTANNIMEQIIEEFINKILDLFMKSIERGVPELHIPPFDPLEIPGRKDIEIKNFLANIQGNFRDFVIKGLASMTLPKLSIKEKKVTATTTSKLEVNGKYSLNGRAMKFITINSNSTFRCGIESLSMTIGLSFKDPKDLKAVVELKSGNVKLELDDFEHSKAASGILDKISGLIAKFVEESMGPALQNVVQKLIDQHKGALAI